MAEIFSIKAKFVDTRFKADNGYIIGIYTTRVKNLPERFRGDRKKTIQFSAKGMDLPTSKKYDIILIGTLSIHPNYGLNMTVSESEIVLTSDFFNHIIIFISKLVQHGFTNIR